jgi:hypothetical protein
MITPLAGAATVMVVPIVVFASARGRRKRRQDG